MITSDLAIVVVMALSAPCFILAVSAMMSLKRFEQLYTMQIQAMTTIIYAIAEMRGMVEEEDDPTDEEERQKPELAPVLPFRGGPDGKPNDPE